MQIFLKKLKNLQELTLILTGFLCGIWDARNNLRIITRYNENFKICITQHLTFNRISLKLDLPLKPITLLCFRWLRRALIGLLLYWTNNFFLYKT